MESNAREVYDLCSVVNHSGNLDNGHYICHIKHASGTWYQIDDHVVKKSSAKQVLRGTG